MRTLLFVLRDIMSAEIAIPVMIKLAASNWPVYVIAEGKAVSVCKKAGVELFIEGDDLLKPFEETAKLNTLDPDVVCIGCSSPNNWEKELGYSFSQKGTPVVAFADTWGALTRLDGLRPDFALVIDNEEARRVYRDDRARSSTIIGDIASMIDTKMPKTSENELRKMCAGRTSVMLVGDHLSNAEEVADIAMRSLALERDPSKFVFFGSFVHPKLQYNPNVTPIMDLIRARLTACNFISHAGLANTNQMAGFCDITITAFSTPGRIALHHGKQFLSVAGASSLALLKNESGLDKYPLVSQCVIPVLLGDRPLSYIWNDAYSMSAKKWAKEAKYNPELAFSLISWI